MTRFTVSIDRLATLVVAVVIAVIGLLALDWRYEGLLGLPERTSTAATTDVTDAAWWPWAVGALGVLLILVGLRWLWAHLHPSSVSQLNLSGTGDQGRLRVNAKAAAAAAATALSRSPWVRSARGRVTRDQGQLVVDLHADVTPDADLEDIAALCDSTAADLARVLRRPDLYCRVRLHVSTANPASSRVH